MCTQTSPVCNTCRRLWVIPLALLFLCGIVRAQISDKISSVSVGSYRAGEPLTIRAEVVNPATIDRIEIAFRPFGTSTFKQSEMMMLGSTASASIAASDLTPPFLEYYLLLYLKDGKTTDHYPAENWDLHPLRVALVDSSGVLPIIIHTPERGEHLKSEDLLISFSLNEPDSTVDRHSTKILLDGVDIASHAVVSGNLYVIQPENASISPGPGSHTVNIELYDTRGRRAGSESWTFNIVTGQEPVTTMIAADHWTHNASVQFESRNETIDAATTPYNRGTLSASSSYGQYRFNGSLYVTNEERSTRQPQDRFFIGAEAPWLKLGLGDNFPVFPELIMSGRRVRGVSGDLTLGFFNLNVAKGEIVRGIDDPDDKTFSRNLLAIRPSFGSEDKSHVGFTYLKSTDDINSIHNGIKPEENLVLGSDLLITLDNHRMEITAQGAFSATNRDISKGTFSDADIDSIFKAPNYNSSDRDDIRRVRDILSNVITVNENLVPLSFRNLSTFAYESGVSFNYFNNNLRFLYLRHGNDYESFGQSFLQKDVAGYTLSDRQALIGNQVFLSGGLEQLRDNTAETKAATTTYTTSNAAVSYYPRKELPNFTLAYLHADNGNGINNHPPQHFDTLYAVDENTDRVLVQTGYGFTYGPRHNASMSVSTSTRDDRSPRNLDSKSTMFTLSDMMTFHIPLQTTVSVTSNANDLATGPAGTMSIRYTTWYANAQYRALGDRMRFSGTLSPTFGDVQRTLIDMGAQYFFRNNISAQTQLSLYLNKNGTDTIWSFILRIDV